MTHPHLLTHLTHLTNDSLSALYSHSVSFCCTETDSDNATESNGRCESECVNECEITSFSTTISSGKLSPSVILDKIPDSSDIPVRFVGATETRHRVDASLMMDTVSLLTDTAELHRRMRIQIDRGIVDTGTLWTTTLSKLLTGVDDMMRGHIADSMSLLSTLHDVYMKHVNYLVTGLSTLPQDCDSLTAEVHIIAVMTQSIPFSQPQINRLKLLLDRFYYLRDMFNNYDSMLNAEALRSSHKWRYFPSPLRIGECNRMFTSIKDSLDLQTQWLVSFIPQDENNTTNVSSPVDADVFTNMNNFRSEVANFSRCLLSYKEELDSFEVELSKLTFTSSFHYEPPTAWLRRFNMDSQWLESIANQYIANSLSKLNLAEVLHTNGSEVLNNADQLYSDFELSLFSKVSDHIDNEEDYMVSVYSDLLRRVTSLQRYMFPNDTSLEQFMRRLSIWRMPMLNFQKSQVLFILPHSHSARGHVSPGSV